MADENKNKTPEEKNEIREKEKSKVRQAKFDLLFRNILCFLSGTFFGMALLSML